MKTLLVLSYCCLVSALFASDKSRGVFPKDNQAMLYRWKHFDVNRIDAAINNAGPYADYLEKKVPALNGQREAVRRLSLVPECG